MLVYFNTTIETMYRITYGTIPKGYPHIRGEGVSKDGDNHRQGRG